MPNSPEDKDIVQIPTQEIRLEISKIAGGLKQEGLLPSGLGLLIVGSVQYRKQSLFYESGANQDHYRGDPELDKLWTEWTEKYDGFSGENLAATALYQHERGGSVNKTFPKPETQEYVALVKRMEVLGKFVKEFEHREGWQEMNKTLDQIWRGTLYDKK